jgi:hypothetical protein
MWAGLGKGMIQSSGLRRGYSIISESMSDATVHDLEGFCKKINYGAFEYDRDGMNAIVL